jgi:hypothetical protein
LWTSCARSQCGPVAQTRLATFAVIAKGDEVLDWREMTGRYPGARIKLLEASDHALSDFDDHIDEVFAFHGPGLTKARAGPHGTIPPMFALFEEAGKFQAAVCMSEAESSAQIELDSGKRVKVKAANVLLKFEKPAPAELIRRPRR